MSSIYFCSYSSIDSSILLQYRDSRKLYFFGNSLFFPKIFFWTSSLFRLVPLYLFKCLNSINLMLIEWKIFRLREGLFIKKYYIWYRCNVWENERYALTPYFYWNLLPLFLVLWNTTRVIWDLCIEHISRTWGKRQMCARVCIDCEGNLRLKTYRLRVESALSFRRLPLLYVRVITWRSVSCFLLLPPRDCLTSW